MKEVQSRKRPVTDDVVSVRVWKVINRYKVGKFFDILIKDGTLDWTLKIEEIEREESYDGLCAVVTDVSSEELQTTKLRRTSLPSIEKFITRAASDVSADG